MNIVLPDGFSIHHTALLAEPLLWTARWSDGANLPLGLPIERNTPAALLPDFFPAGLLLFGGGRFTQVPEGGPELDRLTVKAHTKEHAVHAFRLAYGLNVPAPRVPVPRSLGAGLKPRAAPPGP